MAEEQESSVLFSLKELMNIEEDRVKSEDQERKDAATKAEQDRLEAERKAREAEETRIREMQKRREEDERRGREEAARLDAIQRAELEKARAEAEHKARLEAMTAQQHHERQVLALKEDKGKKTLRNILIGGVGTVAVVAGILIYVFVSAAADREKKDLADAAEKRALQAQIDDFTNKLRQNEEDKLKLEADIKANAGNPAKIAELEAELKRKQEEGAALEGQRKNVSGRVPTKPGEQPPPPPKKCRPGDPLCSDIGN